MNERLVAQINENNCIGCTICIDACPFDAIIGAQNYSHRVNRLECPGCKVCVTKCPTDCIDIVKIKQNKEEIKEKVKFNFLRRKSRKENLKKFRSENINLQLDEIMKS